MRSVESLIDEASQLCKSDAELARRVGVPASHICEWRNGKRTVSPETVGFLCDVLELNAEEARRLLALAVVGNPKNAKKRGVLRRAFFVCVSALALGGVVPALQTRDDQGMIDGVKRTLEQTNGLYIVAH